MMLSSSGKHLMAAAQKFCSPASLRQASQYTGTYILKRRNPPPLSKRSLPEGTFRKLQKKHKIYDTVDGPGTRPLPNIDVLLIQHVEGLGKPGDVVSVKVSKAHNTLLSFGRAVYPSPENLEKYKNLAEQSAKDEVRHSSIYSAQTAKVLGCRVIGITMNLEEPWTLEPWHVRVSLRKAGFIVPEHCIEMPPGPIQGPDVDRLEDKEFYVTVTINACERVPVRCRIHHYATEPRDRLPYRRQPWLHPAEPLFPEQAERLAAMPRPETLPDAEHARDEY